MVTTREILERSATIAVVGISGDADKDAHAVPAAAQERGFKILPVNPRGGTILGERVHRSLADITGPVDIVNVFRPAAEAPDIARQAVAIGARALWLQRGIASAEARAIAEGAGVDYIEDRCIAVESALHRIRKQR